MIPSLPPPTDNLYKFSCIFGLVLIVSSVFAFVAIYSSSLEQKIKFIETKITLEAKQNRSASEEQLLALQNKLIEVTRENEKAAKWLISTVAAVGFWLSVLGARSWYQLVQLRDDEIAQLQLRKLKAEVTHLEALRRKRRS